jgi:ketosteroid isomerase-like protein
MGQEEVELARRAHQLWSQGELEAFIELCDPEIEFTVLTGAMEGRSYRGHSGVRKWFDSMRQAFERFETNVVDAEDLGDCKVLVTIRIVATGRGSGIELEQTVYQLAEGRDGRIQGWEWHLTRAEALAAAGADG